VKPFSTSELQQMLSDFEGQGCGAGGSSMPPAFSRSAAPARPPSRLQQSLATPSSIDLATLEDALSYISSDVLCGNGTVIGPDKQPAPDYWFGVILAVRREYGDAAKEIVRRWSQQSVRYLDGGGFEHAWIQYKPDHPKPVTISSVFMLAEAKGWPGKRGAPATPLNSSSRFRLLDRAAIMAQPPLRWRVKGLFPETGIGAIYGPSTSGKSFLAGDMGVHIALGEEWFGHRTTQCPVTYVMLEGESGLRNRVAAWEVHNGKALPPHFRAMTQPFQLAELDQVEELGATLPKGGVVIIDTMNRAAPGLDENSSLDMSKVLAGMKRLQEITGGLVLVVHHTGKDASKGLRGHSSLLAALDGAIEVERTATSRSWSAAKVKDGEDGVQVMFRLHIIDLGTDSDGDKITSCAVDRDIGAIFRPSPPKGKHQLQALAAIRRALSASSAFGQGGAGPQDACVTFDDALAAAGDAVVGVEAKRRVPRAREAMQGLIDGKHLRRGLDGEQEEWVWL
jgi:hypothetical protein